MAAKEFPLAVVIRAVDRVTAPMRSATNAISRFGANVRATGRGISDRLGLPVLGVASRRLGGSLTQLGRKVAMVGGAIGAMGAAAALAGWQVVQAFADAGGELDDLSQQLGISAERLQEFRYAAQMSGVESGQFDQGLRVLSRNLGVAFSSKKGPVFQVLEGMGVRLKGLNGDMRSTEELLPEIADKMQRIQDPALRAAAAQALLGRAGVRLLPMLIQGSKGMQQWAVRARELGIVIDNETVAAAAAFGDQMDDMKLSMVGVRNIIGTALMPQLQKMIAQVTDFTIKNRAKIQAFFEDFAAKLPARIDTAIKFLGDLKNALTPVIEAVAWAVEKFGGANVALTAFATTVGVILIPPVYACITAIYAMGAALLATPVGWVIAAIIGIVAGLNYLYNKFETVRVIMDAISAAAIWFFMNLTPLGGVIKQWDEMTAAIEKVWGWVTFLWDSMKNGFNLALGWMLNFNRAIIDMIPDWVKNLFSGDGNEVNINASGPAAGAPVGARAAAGDAARAQQQDVRVTVDMNNLPPGTRVSTETAGKPQFELNQGFAMGVP